MTDPWDPWNDRELLGTFSFRYELICRGCGTKRAGTVECAHDADEHDGLLEELAAHVDTTCPTCGPLRLTGRGTRGMSNRRAGRLRHGPRTNRVWGTPTT